MNETEVHQQGWEQVKQKVSELGATDSDTREGAYSFLSSWVMQEDERGKPQLDELLQESLSGRGLFLGIGEKEGDHVFKRTFSSLLIALLLARDNRESYLSRDRFQNTLQALVHYCQQENDFRGYVEGKGWAHSAAHVADALDECALSRHAGGEECAEIWVGMRALLERPEEVYQREEDERLATIIVSMLEKEKVSFDTVCEWLKQMEPAQSRSLESYTRNTNRKHFLRCLFIRLYDAALDSGGSEWKLNQLLELEKSFNRFR
ncbi:DUF2785 domain-containing protein [Gorillibacterium sp. CAU 1737]|uniref:DUF2785 domain-containing protein n=1 Tax=Gorillibacterium sp. CAU 1737 TaxID=3140362 RepID=UPI003261C57A